MQENKFTLSHRVYYYETDKMGRVYHANFLMWMEEARTEFLRSKGISYKELEDIGIIMPVTEIKAKYFYPVEYDEEVIIDITAEKLTKVKVEFIIENTINSDTNLFLSCIFYFFYCIKSLSGHYSPFFFLSSYFVKKTFYATI